MGRNRKWVLEDSIQDAVWKTILRGPRPPSVRWEKQRSQSAAAHPAKDRKVSKKDVKAKDSAQVQQTASVPKVVPTQPRSNRQSPPVARAAAQAKVQRLQAAISALGDVDMIEKENLERALVRAQSQAVEPPVSAQIISAKGFIEKTVGCRRGGSDRGCPESRRVSRQGERRLKELQLQEKTPFTGPVDAESEVVRLRAQVAEFQGRVGRSSVSAIPADAIPLFPTEFSVWMEGRQKDLQEAFSTGDHSRETTVGL